MPARGMEKLFCGLFGRHSVSFGNSLAFHSNTNVFLNILGLPGTFSVWSSSREFPLDPANIRKWSCYHFCGPLSTLQCLLNLYSDAHIFVNMESLLGSLPLDLNLGITPGPQKGPLNGPWTPCRQGEPFALRGSFAAVGMSLPPPFQNESPQWYCSNLISSVRFVAWYT